MRAIIKSAMAISELAYDLDNISTDDKKKIEDEAKKFGESTLPHLILLRLGYMF